MDRVVPTHRKERSIRYIQWTSRCTSAISLRTLTSYTSYTCGVCICEFEVAAIFLWVCYEFITLGIMISIWFLYSYQGRYQNDRRIRAASGWSLRTSNVVFCAKPKHSRIIWTVLLTFGFVRRSHFWKFQRDQTANALSQAMYVTRGFFVHMIGI